MIRISTALITGLNGVWFGVLFGSLLVRMIRWNALTQEKEYRWDRLRLFLSTPQGMRELGRLLPTRADFTRTGFKRPRLTQRMYLSIGLSLVLNLVVLFGLLHLGFSLSLVLVLLSVVQPLSSIGIALVITYIRRLYTDRILQEVSRRLLKDRPIIIGVTGSYGKTSTKLLLAALLDGSFTVCVTPLSVNTPLGIARYLAKAYRGQEVLLLEYAAYGIGEIARLAQQIPPQIAVITGITAQHAGLFGGVSEIVTAKSELPAALAQDGLVVYPSDDARAISVAEAAPESVQRVVVEIKDATKVRLDTQARLNFIWDGEQLRTQLVGTQYLRNALLALAVGRRLGITLEALDQRLSEFTPPEKFMRLYTAENGVRVLDDGDTSNPEGFRAALKLAGQLSAPHRVLVTGGIVDLGALSDPIHSELGALASAVFDEVWYTSAVGQVAFGDSYTGELWTDQLGILKRAASLKAPALICIEGRVPGWCAPALVAYSEQV